MSFNYDGTGVEMKTGFKPLPEGPYDLKIVSATEKVSKGGAPQVVVDFVVVNDKLFDGKAIKYHYITFFPPEAKGAGIALHFLKAIGQPYEGKFAVHPEAWIGKVVRAQVKIEEYEGVKRNKVAKVEPAVSNEPEEAPLPF